MVEIPEKGSEIPPHFFIKYKVADEWHYVLAGTVLSFGVDQVSEATRNKLEADFQLQKFDAVPVDDPEMGLPISFGFYAYQSAKNPFE